MNLAKAPLNTERHVVIYQIPTPPIKITEEKSGTVYDDTTGEEAGSYKIDTNGMITIDFLPSYAGKNDGEGASKTKIILPLNLL